MTKSLFAFVANLSTVGMFMRSSSLMSFGLSFHHLFQQICAFHMFFSDTNLAANSITSPITPHGKRAQIPFPSLDDDIRTQLLTGYEFTNNDIVSLEYFQVSLPILYVDVSLTEAQ